MVYELEDNSRTIDASTNTTTKISTGLSMIAHMQKKGKSGGRHRACLRYFRILKNFGNSCDYNSRGNNIDIVMVVVLLMFSLITKNKKGNGD